MQPKAKVLVTGGAGYIGSHTCKALLGAGYEPVVFDNLSAGYESFVQWGELIHGDIMDTALLTQVMQTVKPIGVIHFASFIQVGESVELPGKYYRNNTGGSLSILEAMRASGVENIVVSSTAAVYGEPEIVPIAESSPMAPLNPYGASKLMMERLLDDFEHAHGLRSAALRYFNAAGGDPDGDVGERHNPETHLIPRVFMAAEGEIPALKLFGDDYPTPDGTCVRDYIHVQDLADAHILALEKLAAGARGIKANLGTGQGYSVKQIIDEARRVIGKDIPYSISPRRAGDSPSLVAKVDRAKEVLGWQAKYSSLENIISTAWHWFLKDKDNRLKLPTL